MRRLAIVISSLVLGASTALVPSPASAAALELGNGCVAGGAQPNYTVLMVAKGPDNPLPITAPSAGVITKARFTMPTGSSPGYPQKLKVARATGASNEYTVVAESGTLPVVSGIQTFDVRVPMAAGDFLGLQGGANGVLYCNTSAANVIGVLPGDAAVGSTATYSPQANNAIPVVVTLEPDVDQDGYGDLTQDECPESAAYQGECPVVVLDSFATPQGGAIVVLVGTDNTAKVKVTGKAKVNGKTIKLKSGTKTVKPGKLAKFTLQLPRPLRDALATLPPSRFIKVKLVATSTDLVGRTAKDKTSVKLYGTR
jgi:hypothetical protein